MRLSQYFQVNLLLAIILLLSTGRSMMAGDWPQWRSGASHTAVSAEDLPDQLHFQWIRSYDQRVPVWDDPLNQDMMPYDRIFEPVVADGRMYIGFNDSDKVTAIDVITGEQLWEFFTNGPVRFAPVVFRDRVLFASDDGYLYCVSAEAGELLWRFRGGPSERKVIGNRRVISTWPARGGPVLEDGTVYFAAGIWPFMGTFIYALDAETGEVLWLNDATSAEFQEQPHSAPSFAGVAPQGQMAVAGDELLIPGGRSLPAILDRHTGEQLYFDFGGKGEGGSFVAAGINHYYVHTRARGTMALNMDDGTSAKFAVNEPVIDGNTLYTATDSAADSAADRAADREFEAPTIIAYGEDKTIQWSIMADGTGDLIRCGRRLYAAGNNSITAINLPTANMPASIAWSIPVEGEVLRLLAANDRLFAVTLNGQIMAFGADNAEPKVFLDHSQPASEFAIASDANASDSMSHLPESIRATDGYALWFGLQDLQLLESVLSTSSLHIVCVDSNAKKVADARKRFDSQGIYGERITAHQGIVESFQAPPYIASLVVLERSIAERMLEAGTLSQVYESVRPYGGTLWIPGSDSTSTPLVQQIANTDLSNANISTEHNGVVITRVGALPDSAPWTHAYGDVANTVKSNDSRVKLPLGILWFGGNSNLDVLPRHGHGPSEQVIGGRLFIEGMSSLLARDVYTGRVLWKREFNDLGNYQVYYDETYADTPFSTSYNQVHLPGANARGTNYVATSDGVYLVIDDRCLLLDCATGETLHEFVLPATDLGPQPEWGYVGVYENLLLAGVNFGNYTTRELFTFTPEAKKGPAWNPDHSSSLGLMAFDRKTGEVLWQVDAKHGFLHNGIVAGGGRIYLLDKLPKRVEEQSRRRGIDTSQEQRLLAVDAQTGETVWSIQDNVFGSWLSYSDKHDLLVHAGAAAKDRSLDEVDRGLSVLRAGSGETVWEKPQFTYAGPVMLHGDTIITNTTSYTASQGALSLLDGSMLTINDPVTGDSIPWQFTRTYGCNTAVASENLLTFRSGAAGFYDLANHGGTGNFGGFKSGCSSSLIVADGVLNAPDYTRTCTCGYQNQTSLALVPMQENELWTYNLFAQSENFTPENIQRIGINFGAPGDRLAEDGTLWVNYPPDSGASPQVELRIDGEPNYFTHHTGRFEGKDKPWVASSGVMGAITAKLFFSAPVKETPLLLELLVAESNDDAEENASGEIDLSSSDLEMTLEKSIQTVGIRFAGCPLQAGSLMNNACIQFEVDESTSVPTQLEVYGVLSPNARTFSTKQFDISSRPRTKSSALWHPKPWRANDRPGADHRTPDLTSIINEITSLPNWEEGNALAFVITGTGKRVATSSKGGNDAYPRLLIDQELPEENIAGSSDPEDHTSRNSTVRLYFAEPDDTVRKGDRVFDILIQGKTVKHKFDILAESKNSRTLFIMQIDDVEIGNELHLELIPKSHHEPILCGIEVTLE
jgi:outer membrane protein assembly factor BamB